MKNQRVGRCFLSVEGIYDYVPEVDAGKLKPVLEDQVGMNRALISTPVKSILLQIKTMIMPYIASPVKFLLLKNS